MLTGSHLDAEDRVYSEPFSHLPPNIQKAFNDSESLSKNRPVRSSRNRTAFKNTRTAVPPKEETDLAKHDLSASPSPEHVVTGVEGEGPLTRCTSLDGEGLYSGLPELQAEEKVHKPVVLTCRITYCQELTDICLNHDLWSIT